ncbi:GNAT family N-acetyltransferase [Neobacillus sp. GCM10023253]|uniref:GNAT family N-acetyltransferase n=1 Tax=Neobacillus sp. GCM10023253 TaxID=3252644 RepID=UPI00360868A6
MQTLIRKATKGDLDRLKGFLTRANLGTDGLSEETIEWFLLLEDEQGELVGSLGMEVCEQFGLLRSLVVTAGQAEKEIFVLFDQMVKLAKEKEMESLFLATNKGAALPLFELMGFEKIGRGELPVGFYQSEHIRHVLNVDNSLFLRLTI